MKRRHFIATSANAGLMASLAPNIAAAAAQTDPVLNAKIVGEPARIDESKLTGRNHNRSTVVCRHGVCATSQSIASAVGAEILKSGGNAIDAAISMNAMMAVVEPMSCGPGGDLFAIVWIEKDQKLYGLNASGRSPYAWSIEAAKKKGYADELPVYGPHTWSVPGCVSGWDALQGRFGSMKFDKTLAPAYRYAEEGFVVSEIISGYFSGAAGSFRDYPNALATFVADGEPPKYGQVFKNPDIAAFYRKLMRDGAKSYYQGEIAQRIVNYSNERGGLFTLKDFEDHTVAWVDPVSCNYRGYDVWEIPPNGQGIAALQILNMLEQFDIPSMKPNSAEQLHLFIEAKKLAFEDRAVYYADMDKSDVPLKELISKEYAKERAKLIDPRRAATHIKPGALDGSSDTIYLCASDNQGNMVSLIQSNYYGWGSREVPTGLGFCLQNRGRSFSLDANHHNSLEPHKRPFHTIIPGFVTKDGEPKCAFGVMGGDMQPQGHAQVIMNMIDFSMSIQQAGEQPRVQHSGSTDPWGKHAGDGGTVSLEASIDNDVVFELIDKGHVVSDVGKGMHGGYQAIWREDGPRRYFAGSDPRKDGSAVGY